MKKLAKRVRAGTLKLDGIVIETTGMYVHAIVAGLGLGLRIRVRVRVGVRVRLKFRVR